MRRRMTAYAIAAHRANLCENLDLGLIEDRDGERNNSWRKRMCLSTQALFLFISLLPQEIVKPSPSEIMIAADAGDVSWANFDGEWCTVAPLVSANVEVTPE